MIRAVAIPRLDTGAVGIHLAWSGPELTPLAIGGYEVRRRNHLGLKTTTVCAAFDTARLTELAQTGVLPDELGLMSMHTWQPTATSIVGPLAENVHFTVFTQELSSSTDQVSVTCTARAAAAIAISGGKSIAIEIVPAAGVTFSGQAIDTVVVYALEPTALRICAMQPAEPDRDAASWAAAEVIATGLTLPLHETDPSLVDPAHELAKARERLLSNETFTSDEATNLAAALRRGAADQTGRPCDRVLLDRTDSTSPYQESTFSTRIALVTLDPRLRRVLGFGHADTTAVAGQSYDYRVSGQFLAADLADEVYDVHQITSGTALPTAFHIGDVNLRLGAPTEVVLDPAADSEGLTGTSRRGITLTPGEPDDGFVSWWSPDLSCVIDLPRTVERLVLEVPASHGLSYSGSVGGSPAGPFSTVPPGPAAVLTFASPVNQVRLAGDGTLYALRLPAGVDGVTELSQVCGPVQLAPLALPAPPVTVAAVGLQTPPTILTGPIDEQTPVTARPQPGFRVLWEPAILGTSTGWPDDLDAEPPIDALAFVVEHRRVYDATTADPWEPIQAGDNVTFGSWLAGGGPQGMGYGVDLNVAFPLQRRRAPGATVAMSVTDVLSDVATSGDPPRAAAPLGSSHQYRIQTMDVVGRVSATWTESSVVRLEKRIPPPLPVGPQPEPELVGNPPRLSAPLGVRSRTILASDPDLSAADSALLGTHQSAVVLEWGWRPSERELDPTTQEFRVYAQSRVPTVVPGLITSVTAGTGQWVLGFTTDRDLVADECAGQWLTTGDQAFRIVTHTAGSTPQLTVAASLVNPATSPLSGSTVFGRPLTAGHQRPAGWDSRVAVVPLTAADSYSFVLYDLLSVSAESRTDEAWVGVSAADAESYVPDELPANQPNGGRPGNESSIASVTATARYSGRPDFAIPPPLGDIPEIVADEPTGRSLSVTFDGSTLLGGAIGDGTSVALDRCPLDAVLAITSLSGSDVVMRRANGTLQVVVFANPGDETAVRDALASDHPEFLASRYALYLAGHFDEPGDLFTRTDGILHPAGGLTDRVPPKPGRYFYRVRLADASGAVSVGGAILPMVVRVPSTMPMPAPVRRGAAVGTGTLSVDIALESDPDLAWALLFCRVGDYASTPPDPAGAQLLRMPNRRDLYPDAGVRLRLADGNVLTPITASTVAATTDADGLLDLTLSATLPDATPGQLRQVQYWCYGLSRDGVPSRPLGPYTLTVAATP
ncbi:MAG TPA: hypothetical protein VMJ65_29730 [Solirubrobacteraceae bacterium]|nr:hypothetical protein [Solirubrobacteraceae bacterium]